MLLHYSFTGLKTKRITFEKAFIARDSVCLEQLKELSAKRRLIDESVNDTSRITEATAREMAGGLTCRIEQDIQKLEHYLPLLQNFIIQVDSVSASPYTTRWISDLRIRWTSVLGSSPTFNVRGPKYFQINSLKYEVGMALFLYASTLREKAFEDHQEDIEGLKISASLLRKSAGIFNYLTTEVVPSLQHVMTQEKPPEVTTNVSSAMSLLCLAEAQAVAIKLAEKRKMSASSLAKLHYGVTQLLDEANVLLSLGSGDVSGKFMEFIESCRNLHELRSYRHLAESYKELEQVGVAIGLLNRALNNCKNYTPRNQSWREVFKNEVNNTSELLKKYNKDNEIVREKIPLEFELPALEGTKMVIATPYEPEKWERQLAFK